MGDAPIRTEPLRSGQSIDRLRETYRSGATLVPYSLWSAVSLLVGTLFMKFGSPAVALSFFIAGPLAFVLQLVRARRDAVTVEPDVGLHLANGAVIGWERIRSVESRGIRHVFDTSLYYRMTDAIETMWSSNHRPDIKFYGTVGLVLVMLLYGFATGVLVPVMLILSPWQHRVVITLKAGQTMSWRDLRKAESFIRRVELGIANR